LAELEGDIGVWERKKAWTFTEDIVDDDDVEVSVHLNRGGRGGEEIGWPSPTSGDAGRRMVAARMIWWRGRRTWSPSCYSFLLLHIFPCSEADKARVGLRSISGETHLHNCVVPIFNLVAKFLYTTCVSHVHLY
jgi:hypothetical protein